jgi:hypothetical protein
MYLKESDFAKIDVALKAKYLDLIKMKAWTFRILTSSDFKGFRQSEVLEKYDLTNNPNGACYGFALEWMKRYMRGKSTYFDPKFKANPESMGKLAQKADALHTAAKLVGLNANLGDIGDAQRRFDAALGRLNVVPKGLSNLTLSRIEIRLDDAEVKQDATDEKKAWEQYKFAYGHVLTAVSKLAQGDGIIFSFVAFDGGAGGHSLGVMHKQGGWLYFDPNVGQRQFTSHTHQQITDAVSTAWAASWRACKVLRIETVKYSEKAEVKQDPESKQVELKSND